ncbi:hypothetical protein R5R35_007538 [Gryllus longicercus]|uniref:Uncharacterized protein n=1 Tax=Gryllus longicercus TaxID=2509291 RepID=A0AAN9VTH5_9ORTH
MGPRSLLDVPEHLHVAAVEVAPAALAALLAGRLTPTLAVNRLAIYRLVVDRKRKRFLECHGFANANVENTFVVDNYNSAFDNIHQNYAMLLLISSGVFRNMDSKPFENEVAKFKTSMIKEKTGVIWLDENGKPNFSHISFLNYFAASWIYSTLQSYQLCPLLENACSSLYLGQRGRAECEVRGFLELMLDEGRPLHQDDTHQKLERARARIQSYQRQRVGTKARLHLTLRLSAASPGEGDQGIN